MDTNQTFRKILFKWYKLHRRDLPFRRTRDPYKIWISEVIFQQTRISQGMEYYLKFVKRFPDVRSLARASEREVLSMWQGLGYYTRARNLLRAAKQITTENNGRFPGTYEEIRKLKGIGDYSAAAIASVSFNLPYPAVDGNVMRFLARYAGIRVPVLSSLGRKEIMKIASVLIDRDHPGEFNQAMIEIGALQCIPHNPTCTECPFKRSCYAYNAGMVMVLPVKKQAIKPVDRYFYYLVISKGQDHHKIYIRHRSGNDIWKNLYDFPLIETTKPVTLEALARSPEWKELFGKNKTEVKDISTVYKHVLTHRVIHARFIRVKIPVASRLPYKVFQISGKSRYPFPRLIEKYLEGKARK